MIIEATTSQSSGDYQNSEDELTILTLASPWWTNHSELTITEAADVVALTFLTDNVFLEIEES
jgi:hypothetical protein